VVEQEIALLDRGDYTPRPRRVIYLDQGHLLIAVAEAGSDRIDRAHGRERNAFVTGTCDALAEEVKRVAGRRDRSVVLDVHVGETYPEH